MNSITLRPYAEVDRAALAELLTNDSIKETFMIPDFPSQEALKNMVERLMSYARSDEHYERGVYFCDVLIGFVNDVEIDDRRIEVGYVIHPKYQGKGYATQALTLAIRELLALGFDEIDAAAFAHNIASRRVMEKCGMKLTEKTETITYHHQAWSCVYYALRLQTVVRPLTLLDYDDLYALWLSCSGMGLNNLDDSREGVARFLQRNPTTCFAAEKSGLLVGTILTGNDGRRGYIYHTAVHPAHRKQGIASQLVEASLAALKAEGIHKVALVAFARNKVGNEFWEQMGFSEREDIVYRKQIDVLLNGMEEKELSVIEATAQGLKTARAGL